MVAGNEIDNISDDDEFMKSVQKRREFVEKITIISSLAFLINSIVTFSFLKYFLKDTAKHSYTKFALLYGENVLVAVIIILIFNRFKF